MDALCVALSGIIPRVTNSSLYDVLHSLTSAKGSSAYPTRPRDEPPYRRTDGSRSHGNDRSSGSIRRCYDDKSRPHRAHGYATRPAGYCGENLTLRREPRRSRLRVTRRDEYESRFSSLEPRCTHLHVTRRDDHVSRSPSPEFRRPHHENLRSDRRRGARSSSQDTPRGIDRGHSTPPPPSRPQAFQASTTPSDHGVREQVEALAAELSALRSAVQQRSTSIPPGHTRVIPAPQAQEPVPPESSRVIEAAALPANTVIQDDAQIPSGVNAEIVASGARLPAMPQRRETPIPLSERYLHEFPRAPAAQLPDLRC